MRAWFWLAVVEWRKSFAPFRRGGQHRLDFFWLTVLLFLSSTLMLFLWGSKEGLLNRFMEVSVGYLPGHGIPIWVRSELAEDGSGFLLDHKILKEIQQIDISNIEAYPFREVEAKDIRIPGYEEYYLGYSREIKKGQVVWHETGDPRKMAHFKAWAVYSYDPLWNQGNNDATLTADRPQALGIPSEVVLSRALFEKHFDCEAYRRALKKIYRLPESMLGGIKELRQSDCLWCLRSKNPDESSIWLSVKVARERELTRCKVRFVPRIQTMEKVALLFPLSTLHALIVSHGNSKMKIQLEGGGRPSRRAKKLWIWGDLERIRITDFSNCICARLEERAGYYQLVLGSRGQREDWVRACAAIYGIQLRGDDLPLSDVGYADVVEGIDADEINHDSDGNLIVSMEALNKQYQKSYAKQIRQGSQQCKVDMIRVTGGFSQALVYVKDRRSVVDSIAKIKQLTAPDATKQRRALTLDESYEDAVARFGFINDVVTLIKRPYLLIYTVFLLSLLIAQVGMAINHRKANYGILLSKGFCVKHIYMITISQVGLCFTVGYVFALAAVQVGIAEFLHLAFHNTVSAGRYNDYFSTEGLNLMPLFLSDYVILFCLGITVALFITLAHLYFVVGLRSDTEPCNLLHS